MELLQVSFPILSQNCAIIANLSQNTWITVGDEMLHDHQAKDISTINISQLESKSMILRKTLNNAPIVSFSHPFKFQTKPMLYVQLGPKITSKYILAVNHGTGQWHSVVNLFPSLPYIKLEEVRKEPTD